MIQRGQQVVQVLCREQLNLVEHQQTGPLRKAMAIGLQFALHHLHVLQHRS